MWDLTSQDLYLNAVMLHSSLCLHGDCVRYVHNCLGLWDVFFSMVVLSYNITTNDFNFVISKWFGVAIAVGELQMYTAEATFADLSVGRLLRACS